MDIVGRRRGKVVEVEWSRGRNVVIVEVGWFPKVGGS